MEMIIDPNGKASANSGVYGLPYNEENSKVVYIPVPWDVTTSYIAGTHQGPEAIFNASEQIDFFDLEYKDAYKQGLFMQKEKSWIKTLNKKMRTQAQKIIDANEEVEGNKTLEAALKKVNDASKKVNDFVEAECDRLLAEGKIPVVVGGDHSTPYGAIKSYAKKYKKDFGVLHFDAHSDTRIAYMGFEHSHASIMYNASKDIPSIKKFVQVGIRDFCEQEYEYTKKSKKFDVYFDLDLQKRKLKGEKFEKIAKEIVSKLPKNIYISFDIDGLDPRFCPHTGTPVPGGLDYNEVVFILNTVVQSGRKIVGFDLVEVCPSGDESDEWDANVGMRLLYKMTSACMASQKIIKKN
ncbi:agmatinase family protein [Bacteriovorax sp. Seq25_V]|uniref:agmatinase family protein n=1 Tax=Bacteriovorax sp. Seq25_V TaxID=1201288 RepID=UPI00038A45AA|nr:agmatinase family protein [Bacteriovorax sp. Seq25_V]EQC43765.1 putative agmatinase [Bacteriovorax sp. Seq25_V]